MPSFFTKIIGGSLLAFITLLSMSGVNLETLTPSPPSSLSKAYNLRISGNLNKNFSEGVVYETEIHTVKGVSFSTLKLKFKDDKSDSSDSIEFLVSKQGTAKGLSLGVYKVSTEQGFLNYFDGVFGFANINDLGELPLFARSGSIQITQSDATMIKGVINIKMTNAAGKAIRVRGNFEKRK